MERTAEWDGPTYDRVSGPQARWGKAVLGRLELAGGETVLDAGCGTGRVTEQLLARLPRGRVVALDASASMLAEARSRLCGDNVRFVQADLLGLGPEVLGDWAPVDGIFSTATFHWVTDHDRLFANLRSVARPGAQLVAQFGGEGNIQRLIATVQSLGAERAGTWLYPAPEETAKRLERAGFEVVEVWAHPEPVSFPDVASLAEFLETVCLREHMASLGPDERRPFARRVAEALPGGVIDYVRLNVLARAR